MESQTNNQVEQGEVVQLVQNLNTQQVGMIEESFFDRNITTIFVFGNLIFLFVSMIFSNSKLSNGVQSIAIALPFFIIILTVVLCGFNFHGKRKQRDFTG